MLEPYDIPREPRERELLPSIMATSLACWHMLGPMYVVALSTFYSSCYLGPATAPSVGRVLVTGGPSTIKTEPINPP